MKASFRRFAERVDKATGTPWAFISVIAIIVCWLMTGPFFGFSEQWQLVINTITTIITFLMVFIIQNTQERDFKSLQLKLDALILSAGSGRGLVALEELTDDELARLEQTIRRLRGNADIDTIVETLENSAARHGDHTAT
jgi:low affinity Fe/Cu permease